MVLWVKQPKVWLKKWVGYKKCVCFMFRETLWISWNLWGNSTTQMKTLRKVIDCENLGKLQEVYFSKVASLQCKDCNSTINNKHSFQNIFRKLAVLKRLWGKKVYSVLVKLWPCGAEPTVLPETKLIWDFCVEALKNLM